MAHRPRQFVMVLAALAIAWVGFDLSAQTLPATQPATRQPVPDDKSLPLFRPATGMILPVPEFEQSPLLRPNRVTLHFKAASAKTVAAEITRQIGVPFVWPQPDRKRIRPDLPVTLDLDNVPLLEALMEFCSQTGMVPSIPDPCSDERAETATGRRIVLKDNEPGHGLGRWCVSGPFLFHIKRVDHRITRTNQPKPEETCCLSGDILIDPRVRVLQAAWKPRIIRFVDELGQSLVSHHAVEDPKEPVRWSSPPGGITLYIGYPPNAGRKIAHLHGLAPFLVQVNGQTIEVPQFDKFTGGDFDLGDMTLHIGPAKGQELSRCLIQMVFRRGKHDKDDWKTLSWCQSGVKPLLLDIYGRPMIYHQSGGSEYEGDEIRVTHAWRWNYNIDRAPRGGRVPPGRLVIEVPLGVKRIDAPVQFDDLPLP